MCWATTEGHDLLFALNPVLLNARLLSSSSSHLSTTTGMAEPNVLEQSPRKLESSTCSIGRLLTLQQRRLQSTEDMANHTVKADSVMQFLDELLPWGQDFPALPHRTENPFQTLKDADCLLEIEVEDLFVRAVADSNLCPGLIMCRSEARPDPLDLDTTRQKVDTAFFYPKDAPTNGCPCWPDQVLPAEFKNRKHGNKLDAFDDRLRANLEPETMSRKSSRGQMNSYSELVQALQFRAFLFMLFIIGRRFRLLRWDRSGVIITESTDYFEFPDLLCDFLWRISHSSRTVLGYDTTATRLPLRPDLTNVMDDILEELLPRVVDHEPRELTEPLPEGYVFKYIVDLFAESLSVKEWPRYQLAMVDSQGQSRSFLVGKPVVQMRGTTGRATRGYVAYDLSRRKLVWLKDTWRTWYAEVEMEGDVILRLNAAGIEGVPTVECQGDVEDQLTLTAAWWERQHPRTDDSPSSVAAPDTVSDDDESSSNSTEQTGNKRKRDSLPPLPPSPSDPRFRADTPVRHRRHYRMVVDEICLELKQFLDARQLVNIFLDCIDAHYHATSSPHLSVHVLHRDITDSNIMIYPVVKTTDSGRHELVWTGMLIDWEMSKPIVALLKARQPGCTGTWQFTSVRLLVNSAQPVAIADEMESFLFILIYYALRYLPSSISRDMDVASFIDQCYDVYSLYENRIVVGQHKGTIIHTGKLNHAVLGREFKISFGNPPLDKLISILLRELKNYYRDARILSSLLDSSKTPASPSPTPRRNPKRRRTKSTTTGGPGGETDTEGRVVPRSAPGPSQVRSGRLVPSSVRAQPLGHKEMIKRFLEAMKNRAWVEQPAIPDRVAAARYKSPYQIVPVVPPGNLLSESELEKHML